MGHFNTFPLNPKDKVPEHRLADWVKLISGMRAKGGRVVILNHPRWPSHVKGPFGRFRLNRLSGERSTGPRALTFDAIELVNSTTKQGDPQYLVTDWFALLNSGERIFAVGSSDSHTVGDPVGQGRTYVPSTTDDPAKIDVGAACDAIREGRSLISKGIFCDARVAAASGPERGKLGVGSVLRTSARAIALDVRVATPSWIRAREVRVYLNGERVATRRLGDVDGPRDTWLRFDLPKPPHDSWLVCTAVGDPVRDFFWRTLLDYTFGATNPIWLDVDGRKGFESPRALAKRLVAKAAKNAARLDEMLKPCDDAVAVQALASVRRSFPRSKRRERIMSFVAGMPSGRPVYAKYLASIAPRTTQKRTQKKAAKGK